MVIDWFISIAFSGTNKINYIQYIHRVNSFELFSRIDAFAYIAYTFWYIKNIAIFLLYFISEKNDMFTVLQYLQ